MVDVSIAEAKAKFSEIVDKAGNGETQVITRRGRPIAKIVPADAVVIGPQPKLDVDAMRRHIERMIADGAPVVDSDAFLKAWKDEQRY